MKKIVLVIMALMFLSMQIISAQGNNSPLKNKHSISFNMGVKGNSKAAVSAVGSAVDLKSGFTGGFDYGYWFSNEWQLGINISLVEAATGVNWGGVNNNAVVSFLFGFKYYPEALKLGGVGRCFAGIYAGPVIGFANKTTGLFPTAENITETVIGGQALIGVDLFVAKWLKLGPALNYNFISDFTEISGDKKNFSGFGFVFNFGIVL